ncbi:hypothetical protein Tco_1200419 [Tanacetum coccineum]
MVPATAPLIDFSGEIIWPIGQISLSVKIGDMEHSTSTRMNFVVVRSPSSYNGIIGRPGVRKIQAGPSTAHGMLKFPILGGILTLRSSKLIPLECTMVSGPKVQPRHIRLETSRHDRGSAVCNEAPAERSRRMSPGQTEEKEPSTRKKQGNTRGSRKTCGSRHHEGSSLSQLDFKPGNGKKNMTTAGGCV